jgi:hypothetical protein
MSFQVWRLIKTPTPLCWKNGGCDGYHPILIFDKGEKILKKECLVIGCWDSFYLLQSMNFFNDNFVESQAF